MRLFVAVWPPDEVLEKLAKLPRPQINGLRWTARHQWHVTLRFLGQVEAVGPVVDALEGAAAAAPTVAKLGPAVDRFDQHVLHVPVAGLDEVAASVAAATAHLGRPPDDRPYRGHVTLARVANRARVDLRPLTGTSVAAEWPVDAVCLVQSRLSSAGARYDVLRRLMLPLRPEARAGGPAHRPDGAPRRTS